jgi:hypothetical protein
VFECRVRKFAPGGSGAGKIDMTDEEPKDLPSATHGIAVLIGVTVIVLLIGFAGAALLLWR